MARTSGKIVIDRGEDFSKVFKFRVNGGVDPVDLIDADEIEMAFPKSNGTFHVCTLEGEGLEGGLSLVESSTTGDLLVEMSKELTELLRKGDNQNIEVAWVIAGSRTIVILERVLQVCDPRGL